MTNESDCGVFAGVWIVEGDGNYGGKEVVAVFSCEIDALRYANEDTYRVARFVEYGEVKP